MAESPEAPFSLDVLLAVFDQPLPGDKTDNFDSVVEQPQQDEQHEQQQNASGSGQLSWLESLPQFTPDLRDMRTSTRRKAEILQLRSQMVDLKRQLACMAPSTSNTPLRAPRERTAGHLWMQIAERQQSERQRVEEENARLCEAYSSQKKHIRNIRRVLRKVEKWKQVVLNNRDLVALRDTDEDRSIISHLVQKVEKHLLLSMEIDASSRFGKHKEKLVSQIYKEADGRYYYNQEHSRVPSWMKSHGSQCAEGEFKPAFGIQW